MIKLTSIETGKNSEFDYDYRLKKLINLIGSEAHLITNGENIYYLTGFKGTAGMLVVCNSKKYLVVDCRYYEMASKIAHDCRVILSAKTYPETLLSVLKEVGIKDITLTPDGLLLVDFQSIKKVLEKDSIDVHIGSKVINSIRIVKDKKEIEIIKENLNKAEVAMTKTLPLIKENITERDLATELEYRMRLEGGDKTAFDTILLFGERTSLPHGMPSDRKLKKGDNILIDFGLSRNGYRSDITRTFFFSKGENFDKMSKIYNTVKEAHDKAIEGIHSEMLGKDADKIARDIIINAGYGEYFGHGLGHGVGLDIHELPRLSPIIEDSILEGGSIVTVEPGIYIPGMGGVRIENMIIVTKDSGVSLNITPTDLIIL